LAIVKYDIPTQLKLIIKKYWVGPYNNDITAVVYDVCGGHPYSTEWHIAGLLWFFQFPRDVRLMEINTGPTIDLLTTAARVLVIRKPPLHIFYMIV